MTTTRPLPLATLGRLLAVVTVLACAPVLRATGIHVTINEVHYHPGDGTQTSEFVELHNYGREPVDVSFWELRGGVRWIFPQGSRIAAGAFLLVAKDVAMLGRVYQTGGLE